MVPCPYVKRKTSGLVETGIIYFVGPDVASRTFITRKTTRSTSSSVSVPQR